MKKANLALVMQETEEAPQNLIEFSEKLAKLNTKITELETEVKTLNKEYDEIGDVMLKLMQSKDLQKFTTSNGTFYVHIAERASIKDTITAFKFLRKVKCGDIIKETVNSNTLSSTYKQLREAKLIDDKSAEKYGLAVFLQESVRIRKAG